jgi:6-phosphogluconate dehydrogenase (decarboxylating)
MQLGMIGLGRMGANMVRRLLNGGHQCVVFDRSPQSVAALVKDAHLSGFAGRVSDSGEGRWTIKAAIDEAVPVRVLSTALYQRFSSRGESDFQDRLLSAMRYEFGGHLEREAGP